MSAFFSVNFENAAIPTTGLFPNDYNQKFALVFRKKSYQLDYTFIYILIEHKFAQICVLFREKPF